MNKVKIGKLDHGPLILDVDRLIKTRMAVFGASGVGKTVTLFTILQQTRKILPQCVIDPEDDFVQLRRKHDYVIASPKGGDVLAHPSLAEALAKRWMEKNFNLILGLYEMPEVQRHLYVKIFLETVHDAPRKMWRPRLLMEDEAHDFAPEKASGSSQALAVNIAIAKKGRKRKIGFIVATQRPADISKAVTSQLGNKLIGGQYQDGDRKRAAAELEFTTKEEINSLRRLEPGHFYAYGPALGYDIKLAQILLPKDMPDEGGKNWTRPPRPSKHLKNVLLTLNELPKEAQEEARTLEEFKHRVKELETKLRHQPVPAAPKIVEKIGEQKVDVEKLKKEIQAKYHDSVLKWQKDFVQEIKDFGDRAKKKEWQPFDFKVEVPKLIPVQNFLKNNPIPQVRLKNNERIILSNGRGGMTVSEIPNELNKPLGQRQKEILYFLCSHPDRQFKLAQMALMIGSPNNGTFSNLCSDLATRGLINRENSKLSIRQIDDAFKAIGSDFRSRNSDLAHLWGSKLKGRNLKIYEYLLGNSDGIFTLAALAEALGFPNNGTFSNLCSYLSGQGVAIRENGTMRLNPDVLELP